MKVSGDEIDLEVKLGLLFKPFKAKFESHIAHRLDELLLAAAPDAKPSKAGKAAKAVSKKKT